MKKSTLLGSIALFGLMIGCQGNKDQYTIQGNIAPVEEGKMILLLSEQGEAMDTAVVKEGIFTFKGKAENLQRVWIANAEKERLMDLFLENGKIILTINDSEKSAKGTANNDIYQSIKGKAEQLSNDYQTALSNLRNPDLDEEGRNKLSEQIEQSVNELNALIDANITNVAGVTILKNSSNILLRIREYKTGSYYKNIRTLLDKIPSELKEMVSELEITIANYENTEIGKKFVDFEMKDPNDQTIKLSDYAGKGKVVLVDFWASWCGPCIRFAPTLVSLYEKYQSKGFEIVGVSFDNKEDKWKEAIEKHKLSWIHMTELKGWNTSAGKIYNIRFIPSTVLLDKEGTIIARNPSEEELEKTLESLLSK